jgi:dolichol-phosphate mannosyltransferase
MDEQGATANSAELLAIVVPTLDEAENVEPLVELLLLYARVPVEILFVDDGSTDGTRARVLALSLTKPVRLIERNSSTLGLAGAVIAGARAAHGDLLVVMDADLSHPPQSIPDLLRPIIEDRADMVVGSRYVPGASTPGWPVWRRLMSRSAAAFAFPLTRVHDSLAGFFAIRRTVLLELAPRATGFKIAFETIMHGRGRLRVLEIPILFRDRARGTSKMRFSVAAIFFLRWLAALGSLITRKRMTGVALASPQKKSDVS